MGLTAPPPPLGKLRWKISVSSPSSPGEPGAEVRGMLLQPAASPLLSPSLTDRTSPSLPIFSPPSARSQNILSARVTVTNVKLQLMFRNPGSARCRRDSQHDRKGHGERGGCERRGQAGDSPGITGEQCGVTPCVPRGHPKSGSAHPPKRTAAVSACPRVRVLPKMIRYSRRGQYCQQMDAEPSSAGSIRLRQAQNTRN